MIDHLARKVDSIKPLDMGDQLSRNVASATANIEDMPRLSTDEPCQDIEDFSRIGRAISVRIHYTEVLKGRCIFWCELLWLLNHVCRGVIGQLQSP